MGELVDLLTYRVRDAGRRHHLRYRHAPHGIGAERIVGIEFTDKSEQYRYRVAIEHLAWRPRERDALTTIDLCIDLAEYLCELAEYCDAPHARLAQELRALGESAIDDAIAHHNLLIDEKATRLFVGHDRIEQIYCGLDRLVGAAKRYEKMLKRMDA